MGPYIEAGGDEIIECQGREVLIPRGLVIDRVERLAVDIRVALCSEIDPEPQLLHQERAKIPRGVAMLDGVTPQKVEKARLELKLIWLPPTLIHQKSIILQCLA